jgi:hypothetical protein
LSARPIHSHCCKSLDHRSRLGADKERCGKTFCTETQAMLSASSHAFRGIHQAFYDCSWRSCCLCCCIKLCGYCVRLA